MKRTGLILAVIFAVLCAGAPCVMAAAVASKAVTVGGSRSYYYIFDEDAMGSNSAVGLPTQQSVKAYVDSKSTTDQAYTDGVAVTIAAAASSNYTDVSPTATTMPLTTITDDTFTAGQAYRVTFAGNKSGTNAVGSVALALGGSAKSTLHVAAATEGDFHGSFVIYNITAATQEISGSMQCAVAADGDADHVTDTTDFAGGNVALALILTSGHASDTITVYYALVEKLP